MDLDNLSMFLMSPKPANLVEALAHSGSALIDVCLQRALVPNLSKKARQRRQATSVPKAPRSSQQDLRGAERRGSLEMPLVVRCRAKLRIVPTYRHFGGYLHHNALLFDPLLATVLSYGSGSWTGVGSQHISVLSSGVGQMACQMLHPRFCYDMHSG